MSSLSRISFRLLSVAPLLFSGCGLLGGGNKPPTSQPTGVAPPSVEWNQAPVAAPQPVNLPVKEGPAPLVYLVEADSYVRVMDMTDNVELLSMPVLAHQIVAVNPDLGVQVGGATMKPMRLSGNHRYGIYIVSNQENVTRTGRIRPGEMSPGSPNPVRLP